MIQQAHFVLGFELCVSRQVWRRRSIAIVIFDLADNMITQEILQELKIDDQTLFCTEAEIFALKRLFITVFACECAIWEY